MLWNFKCFCNCQISSFSRHTCVLMLFSCQLVRIHVRNWAVRFLPKQDRLPPHFHSKTRQLGKNCKMVYCSFRQNLMGQFILLFATCVSVAVYEASVSPSFNITQLTILIIPERNSSRWLFCIWWPRKQITATGCLFMWRNTRSRDHIKETAQF